MHRDAAAERRDPRARQLEIREAQTALRLRTIAAERLPIFPLTVVLFPGQGSHTAEMADETRALRPDLVARVTAVVDGDHLVERVAGEERERAQAAHQQADYLLAALLRRDRGQPPLGKPYEYKDYGSLVSFGQHDSVGSLMGSLQGKNWFVEGFFARLMYTSLHLMHHKAIMGTLRTGVLALARFLIKRTTPMVKLH